MNEMKNLNIYDVNRLILFLASRKRSNPIFQTAKSNLRFYSGKTLEIQFEMDFEHKLQNQKEKQIMRLFTRKANENEENTK